MPNIAKSVWIVENSPDYCSDPRPGLFTRISRTLDKYNISVSETIKIGNTFRTAKTYALLPPYSVRKILLRASEIFLLSMSETTSCPLHNKKVSGKAIINSPKLFASKLFFKHNIPQFLPRIYCYLHKTVTKFKELHSTWTNYTILLH